MVDRTNLTGSGSLGRDGGPEIFSFPDLIRSSSPFSVRYPGYSSQVAFDDIDDYNNYVRIVNTPRAEGYRLSCRVKYASETSPDSVKAVRTYCKVMTVNVTSPFFRKHSENGGPDTLTLSYSFTY